MSILTRVLSAGTRRKLKKLHSVVDGVNALEPEISALSDDELRGKTAEFRQRLDNGESLDSLLHEAFAVAREASQRTIGLRHFDVQLIGGAVLHRGAIAEMRTGEGKTLVATLPTYLNALTGEGVHVVTVNDYLARRDAEWMGRIYRFLGLKVGALQDGMSPSIRRPIYEGDIIYGQNNEFGFDYLRDHIYDSASMLVQRNHNYAIIDEVDSILIDEARTPMIISGAGSESTRTYYQFAAMARQLQKDRDYEVDEAKRTVHATEEGIERVEKMLGVENLYDATSEQYIHYLETCIKAKELYRRDREYVVKDGEVVIVDEFTGRMQPGRRWSDGIHQAVEAKEGVRVREEFRTQATVTVQNYFRMYDKLSGMTGTALTEATEFENIYELQVYEIPTNRDVIRTDHDDQIYKTEDAKWRAIIDDVRARNENGQPVLIGTVSVDKNEKLARMLERQGIPHELLNAKNHAREGEIIAQAGRVGAVTVATNMAGRGVDIILGGSTELEGRNLAMEQGLVPETKEFDDFVEQYEKDRHEDWKIANAQVKEAGGLYVIGTERHDSRRIDNQLRGRSGRQGDVGESRFYLSLEDDLMQHFAADRVAAIMERLNIPDDEPIEAKMVSKAISRAQRNIESQNFEIRKNVLKYDDVLNKQREVVYGEREKILKGDDLSEYSTRFLENTVDHIIDTYASPEVFEEDWDISGMITAIQEIFPTEYTVEQLQNMSNAELHEVLLAEMYTVYEKKEAEMGAEMMRRTEQQVFLHVLDTAWREHLDEMDHLREGISLRAMGQRDPLVEYQREGYDLFQSMRARVENDFAKYLLHIQAVSEPDAEGTQRVTRLQYIAPAKTQAGAEAQAREAQATGGGPPQAPSSPQPQTHGNPAVAAARAAAEMRGEEPTVDSDTATVGRNDPCPCGSGLKFKKCHGAA